LIEIRVNFVSAEFEEENLNFVSSFGCGRGK